MAWQKVNPKRDPQFWVFQIDAAYDPETGERGGLCTCGWHITGNWMQTAEPSRIHLERAHPGNQTLANARVTERCLAELELYR